MPEVRIIRLRAFFFPLQACLLSKNTRLWMAISIIWQEIRRYGEMAIPPCFSLYYHIKSSSRRNSYQRYDISLLPVDGL